MLRSDDRLFPEADAGRDGAQPLNDDGTPHEFPPAAFGPYRVLHQVGAGSLGPVFRAHDPGEGRLVAVKAFRLDLTPEAAAELAAALETLVHEQPRHPAIAAALAAGVERGTAYLAQEYVAGEALDAVLRGFGPPPPAEAFVTLTRIAEALDRAAGEGIHHGTLHPRDILVEEGGEARVIDLGIAQALERCGLRAPVRRPYSAPERAEGRWDGAADIYSLGAVAFELLTGRRLAGPGRPAVSSPLLSHVAADEIAAALERALAADPADRYPSAVDLVDALAPALKTARRTPPRTRKSRADAPATLPLDASPPQEAQPEPTPASGVVETSRPEPPAPAAAPPPAPAAIRVAPAAAGGDLPLAAAPAPSPPRFSRIEDEDEPRLMETLADVPTPIDPALTVEPHESAEREGPGTWRAAALEPPSLERRPFLPILVAVLVGLAAGFGWGYWTAWQSPGRQAAAVEAPEAPAQADAAPPTADDRGPVEVEDPEVIGERGLPPTTAAGAAGPRRPAPSTGSGASARAGSQAAPPQVAPRSPAAAPAPAPAAPAAVSGRLTIRSTPPGARVLVDGRLRGRTPINVTGLPLRVVQVTVEHPGHRPDQRQVVLSAARPHVVVDAQLASDAPAARVGSLVVDSRPAGARVFLDNREIGATPLSVPDLAPGTYRIRLEMGGFNPWVTAAQVTAGGRTRVAASLEPGGMPE